MPLMKKVSMYFFNKLIVNIYDERFKKTQEEVNEIKKIQEDIKKTQEKMKEDQEKMKEDQEKMKEDKNQ
jgi:F0F1-type ATP synthase membrane subunit b/b'